MDTTWNLSGLILEGICGSGKTTMLHTLLQTDRFVQRSYPSAIVLSEHHTQRVLEARECHEPLAPPDNLALLEQHVGYLEGLQGRLAAMDWSRTKRTNMRIPFLLERFHLTHAYHYPYMDWEHVDSIDRRLSDLNCKLCLLVVPDALLHQRIIESRGPAWRAYLERYGRNDEEILAHYRSRQNVLRGLLARSRLESIVLDTGSSSVEQLSSRVLDFWGAV